MVAHAEFVNMQARGPAGSGGRVTVVAHSMGCEIAARALSQARWMMGPALQAAIATNPNPARNDCPGHVPATGLCTDSAVRNQVASFVFVAPDVDVEDLSRHMAVISCKGMATVYCADDWALNASSVICVWRWMRNFVRAGARSALSQQSLQQDSVDATGQARHFLHHSYLYESPLVVGDLTSALAGVLPGGEGRGNLRSVFPTKSIWRQFGEYLFGLAGDVTPNRKWYRLH